ncbi:MAG: coniferyl aldehyde dehydrogenase [Bryobacterales bacterium]|nr:coniferyl aldehyde dehydrogenase [Bryobacterales bacterium]
MNEFVNLKTASSSGSAPGLRERREALKRLHEVIQVHRDEMAQRVAEDFGRRATEETLLLEVFPILNGIRHAIAHMEAWMRPRGVAVSWLFKPASAQIVYQPLGVVGIVSAWNYPFWLTFLPLVDALAAGNRVLIKPSEIAPRSADLTGAIIRETFDPAHVNVVTGGPEVSKKFVSLPFDHLLFTGSTRVGKEVMKAAAENLTPLTLELGGKSPAIVHESYSLKTAAERIWTGKLYNAGQTCLAPDYALIPEDKVDEFVDVSRACVARLYPALAENPDYTSIVNQRHYERLMGLIADAMAQGAECLAFHNEGESFGNGSHVMPPVAVKRVTSEMTLMREEIFGPVLPVVPYQSLDDAIAYVNSRPRPLALYYFDNHRKRVNRVLNETVSGGVTVNDVILHVAQSGLPFGGVGPSGMGHYHGEAGFRRMSKEKGVFLQGRIASTAMLRPPYGRLARAMMGFLLK